MKISFIDLSTTLEWIPFHFIGSLISEILYNVKSKNWQAIIREDVCTFFLSKGM